MNFSPDQFKYTVEDVVGGVNIVLTQLDTNESRTFFVAGKRDHAPLCNHMDSLTDDLMGQWFNKREKKSKKDKK